LVRELIAALSVDGDEEAAADQVFVENLLTSLRAAAPDDRIASCALTRRKLAQLEEHQASRLHPRSSSNVQ
jgi:FMN-dependent NADH-azoreductase